METPHKDTLVVETDPDFGCFMKAKDRGEPTFTLRAQDISADLVIDFWIAVQLEIRQRIDDGMTVQEAVDTTRRGYRVAPWSTFDAMTDQKINGAMMIAKAMRAFPNRKIAD